MNMKYKEVHPQNNTILYDKTFKSPSHSGALKEDDSKEGAILREGCYQFAIMGDRISGEQIILMAPVLKFKRNFIFKNCSLLKI